MRIMIWLGRLSLAAAVLCLLMMVLSPIGYRLGWWGVPVALLQMIKWGVFAGIAAATIGAIVLIFARGPMRSSAIKPAILGLLLSLAPVAFPLFQYSKVKSLPLIHDITTDTVNPPAFVALAEARKAAPNGLVYKAAENVAPQKQAYADIVPFDSKLSPVELFAKAEATARAMKLDIATASAIEGRIEAVATTLFYGFKDDIVIRIVARDGGSRLDIRSMSRVGKSDVGANAARIRQFVAQLRASGA
jgi:uncharacterized protein (DUF1499 family)